MAVDAATFILELPEFADAYAAQPAMIERALRLAQSQVSLVVFGTSYQDAVFLMAAHNLALSPSGENLRLNRTSTESVYLEQFRLLARAKRPRVFLGGGLPDGTW